MSRINLIILIFSGAVYSEDTLQVVSPEVKVNANKLNKFDKLYSSPNAVLIRASEIDKSSSGISEALNKKSGLYIRDYGGAGGIKSISMRGNTASQTSILYNGFKLNSAQNGMFDLSNLSLNNISAISINKSGASTMFGGNSAGGSVNIYSAGGNDGLKLQSELASFDTKSVGLNYKSTVDSNNNSFQLNGSYRNSFGNYQIDYFDGNETVTRDRLNTQSENINFSANLNYQIFGIINELEVGNWYNWREIPGPVVSGAQNNSDSELSDNSFYIFNKFYGKHYDSGIWFKRNIQNFTDELNGTEKFGFNQSRYETNEYQYFINYYRSYNNFDLTFRNDLNHTSLKGNMADPLAFDSYLRTQVGASVLGSYNINRLVFSGGLRYDYYSDVDNFISYSFQTNYQISDYEVDFNYSRNYRPPAFNELYYLNFGNLDLEPEISHNFDLGFSLDKSIISARVSAFYSEIEDQIIAVPFSPILWSAQNADETINMGFESSIDIKYKSIGFIGNYTRQISQDEITKQQIPYMPEEVIFTELSINLYNLIISINNNYSSFRYILRNNNSEILEDYMLMNARINYTFSDNIKFTFFANNILDTDYEIISNFPMPGLNFNIRGEFTL